jgi:CheY-like chemotaxis protein
VNQQPILLIEDSVEDVEATIRALRKVGFANPIHHCSDGDEALDYLHRRGKYADQANAPRPGVVLLDLNLPGTDGREVLVEAKTYPLLRSIPIIVLTTSGDERDVQRCYDAGANSYIKKPVDFDGFLGAIRRLTDYWFEVVVLPREAERHP